MNGPCRCVGKKFPEKERISTKSLEGAPGGLFEKQEGVEQRRGRRGGEGVRKEARGRGVDRQDPEVTVGGPGGRCRQRRDRTPWAAEAGTERSG